jgi:hypothetical protein
VCARARGGGRARDRLVDDNLRRSQSPEAVERLAHGLFLLLINHADRDIRLQGELPEIGLPRIDHEHVAWFLQRGKRRLLHQQFRRPALDRLGDVDRGQRAAGQIVAELQGVSSVQACDHPGVIAHAERTDQIVGQRRRGGIRSGQMDGLSGAHRDVGHQTGDLGGVLPARHAHHQRQRSPPVRRQELDDGAGDGRHAAGAQQFARRFAPAVSFAEGVAHVGNPLDAPGMRLPAGMPRQQAQGGDRLQGAQDALPARLRYRPQ